ncbi:hypothetical protein [Stenotrophomonas daejeonensis]|nr:hypothetical protein [Stenotrophomonas daejeonensis]
MNARRQRAAPVPRHRAIDWLDGVGLPLAVARHRPRCPQVVA